MMGEDEKNEPNSQTVSVFWLVTDATHEIRGIKGIMGTFRIPQEEVETP